MTRTDDSARSTFVVFARRYFAWRFI
jgi:hypothetical protein